MTLPARLARTTMLEFSATAISIPVPTIGGSCNQQRNRLTLHVGTHQSTVRIVMLKEWNQASRNTNHLGRCDIDVLRRLLGDASSKSALNRAMTFPPRASIPTNRTVLDLGIRRSDKPPRISSSARSQTTSSVTLPFLNNRIRCHKEAVIVDTRVNRQDWQSNQCSCLRRSQSDKYDRSEKCERRELQSPHVFGSNRLDPEPTSRRSCVNWLTAGWSGRQPVTIHLDQRNIRSQPKYF